MLHCECGPDYNQCFGSGSESGFDPDSISSVDPYLDAKSGSRTEKMTHKSRKKNQEISCFEKSADVLF
jgi:hypothetical protein